MRLLEYATVVTGNGHWMKGWQAEDRMPGLSVEIFDVCGAFEQAVIDGSATDLYWVKPFGIKADLPRSLMCSQEDDENWLRDAVKKATEQGVGAAACVEHAAGTDTWVGDNDVIAGPATFTADNTAAARKTWFLHNVGQPALHLSDKQVIKAVTDRVVMPVGDQMLTAWGDPVVNSPGYSDNAVFWSGPITVYLSSIDTDTLFKQTTNESRVIANLVAAIDMPPKQVVRIGVVP